jgi:hypothetical protein
VLGSHPRKFFDVHAATGSAVAQQALERIGALYEVERDIHGKPPDERRRQRQARSRPLADALKAWAETSLPQLSGRSELARAFRYLLARWTALTRVFDDGRIALDNNPAERALRGVAIGRKTLGLRVRRDARLLAAGQADRQRLCGALQRAPTGRVPQCTLVLVPGRREEQDRGLAAALQ